MQFAWCTAWCCGACGFDLCGQHFLSLCAFFLQLTTISSAPMVSWCALAVR